MENGLYKNYKLTKFYEIYNTNKSELTKDNHTYFRYLCFKYIDFIKHIKLPDFLENSNYESVLVEYRCFPHIEFLIRNTILKLGKKWSHTVVCGNLNYDFVKDICKNISKKIKVINTDYDNLTPSEYSKLLTSNSFWDLFNGDKLLIYQEDSCIFKNNIDDFIKWDYIGAPFAKTTNDTPNCVGNGGLSLRTKNTMKKIIDFISVNDTNFNYSTIQYMKNTNLNFPPEDVYFSKNMQEFNVGLVADWESAHEFSSESINNNNSFGGHKFWICNSKWKKRMKEMYTIKNYQFNNDIIKYLKFINKSETLDLTKKK